MSTCIERPRTTCAQGGALATIGSLPRVVALSHASEGCGGNLTNAISTCSGNNGEGYCSGNQIPSSAIREKDIVFGGAARLAEEIRTAQEIIDADLFVVVTGCMTEMIGDDVEGVIRNYEDAQTPVIAVSTPSFEGDAYVGYELILDGIFNKFLESTDEKDEKLVNIFGVVPNFDPFYRGDLEEIKRLLERVGLKVNTFFTPDQTFANILSAPKASLNIQLSRVWGTDFVEKFKKKHNTPYWTTDLPIGADASEKFLRELAQHIDVSEELIEKVIEEENERYYGYFLRTLDVVVNGQLFYYGATVTNSNYAIPLTKFLSDELGWKVDDVIVTDVIKKKRKKRLSDAFQAVDAKGELIFETDSKQIEWKLNKKHVRNHGERYFDDHSPFFLIGSSIEKYAAKNLGAQTLAVSYPVYNRLITDRGYAGYRGGLRLLEDIISTPLAGR